MVHITSKSTAAASATLGARRLRGFIVTNAGASVAFTVMYATQPILPQIGDAFHVSPSQAGLTLLSVTFGLAFSSLGAGRLADRFGPRRVMVVSSALLALLSAAVALSPSFGVLVALRAVQGLVVPGVTVAGLAYLHNELPASWRGRVSGFYIAANTIGGLVGRLGVGLTVDALTWRGGLWLVAAVAALGTAALIFAMPHATATARAAARAAAAARVAVPLGQVARRLWWAPLIGGAVFFPFLTIFTYTPYRLETPPFDLSTRTTSLLYLVYLLGAIAAPLAGNLSDRIGRRPTIQLGAAIAAAGLALTLVNSLPLVIASLALVCIGSLSAHVVANASVSDGANSLGPAARATALSLYTLGFYVGGGLGSFIPGLGWERFGWVGVLLPCAVALAGALLVAARTPPRRRRAVADLPATGIP